MINTIYILSGGLSSRMGTDKGMLLYQGTKLIDLKVDLVQTLGKLPKVLANSPLYDDLSVEIVSDIYKEKGPLGGLHSALSDTNEDWVVLLPIDELNVNKLVYENLFSSLDSKFDAVFYKDLTGDQYLIGAYHKRIKNQVEERLKNNQLSMRELVKNIHCKTLTIEKDHVFQNLNSPEELGKNLVEVRFFGMLEEEMQGSKAHVLIGETEREDLKAFILKNFPNLEKFEFQVAVNKKISNRLSEQKNGQELALLPAFAGG